MRKPIVGETLYLVWIGDRRYKQNNREVTVTKVGRKYFEVNGERCQFFIDTWAEKWEYGSEDWQVWESKEAYEEHELVCKYCDDFRRIFGGYGKPNITLDQARRIKAILNENGGG